MGSHISGVITPLICVIAIVPLLLSLLKTNHEAPSRDWGSASALLRGLGMEQTFCYFLWI